MNKSMLTHQPLQSHNSEQWGMTQLESLVAMAMLVVFTGVVSLVMQFTLRFSVLLNPVS